MFFYMPKALSIYNLTYSTVYWRSLAAILDVLELSNFRHFSSISQNLHDIWPFFLRLCLPLAFLHISHTL